MGLFSPQCFVLLIFLFSLRTRGNRSLRARRLSPLHLQSQTIEVVSPAPRGTPGVRDGKRILRRAHLWPAPAPAAVNTVGACRGHEAQRQDGPETPGQRSPVPTSRSPRLPLPRTDPQQRRSCSAEDTGLTLPNAPATRTAKLVSVSRTPGWGA